MSVSIERAVADDAAAIAEVQIVGVRAAYRGEIPDELIDAPDLERRAEKWAGWLELSRTSTFVAREGRVVIGFCTLHPMPDDAPRASAAEIPAIYVLPSHWRRGIGRLLCERAVTEALALGFDEVVMWVLQSNEGARRFYEALGFRDDGETRVFLERPGGPSYESRYRRNTATSRERRGR